MDFSLKAIFGLDATGLKTELKQLRKETNDFVNQWGSLALASAGAAFVGLAKGAVELGTQLKDTSEKIGINVEALQALNYVAEQNGASQSEMEKALLRTRTAAQEAAEGNKTYADAFKVLGINLTQFLALPAEQRLTAIGTAYKNAADKNAAYNAVAGIFGEKVGPKLMETLKVLATDGFNAVAKSAAAAGHVMSAQTIVALEKADQAINDFKKRATIAVGEIIVNFRSEEGLKLLLFQFLNVVGQFGAGIVDAIVEAGAMIKAVFTGTLQGVLNFYRDGFLDIIAFLAEQLNTLIPDWLKEKGFRIDVASIDALKSAGTGIAAEIAAAIAQTSPSTFKSDVAAYWDSAIADQQKVVDQLNKIDFGPEAKKLTAAGKDITDSGKVAAAALAEGGRKAGEQIKAAAKSLTDAFTGFSTSITRTGTPYESQSTDALRGVRGRLQQQYDAARRSDPNPSWSGSGQSYAAATAMSIFQSELDRVDAELKQRAAIARVAADRGEAYARQIYGDAAVARASSDISALTERSTTAIERIANGLTNAGLIPPG